MKCPGQDTQYWEQDAIFEVDCPQCGELVEFYKDDTTRKCSHCNKRFVNPKMDFGCAAYCQFATECIGTLPEEFVASQENLLKDRLAIEAKRRMAGDFAKIGMTAKLAYHAEKIGRDTAGADLPTVLSAAYLLPVALPDLFHETTVARNISPPDMQPVHTILRKLDAKEELITAVANLLEGFYNQPTPEENISLAVLHDSYLLTMLERAKADTPESERSEELCAEISTSAGKKLAARICGASGS